MDKNEPEKINSWLDANLTKSSSFEGADKSVINTFLQGQADVTALKIRKGQWNYLWSFIERVWTLVVFGMIIGFILASIFFYTLSDYKQYHFFLGLLAGLFIPYLIQKIRSFF